MLFWHGLFWHIILKKLAFVFIGLFDFSGPIQTLLRTRFLENLSWFPNIRSAGGVILVMSLALYPYVYLLARNAFQTQGKRILEVSQAFGYGRTKAFFRAALPMARPWIAGGSMLVLMETLADFGAVSIFNFDTFTTGIYKTWFGFFSLSAAAQLSSLLLFIVVLVVIVEQQMRSKIQFSQVGKMTIEASRINLEGWKKWVVPGLLSCILLMKEMPITLMTRPFGWDTLAVKIFELTSEGEWERAALPSMVLVLAGLIPLVFLNRR